MNIFSQDTADKQEWNHSLKFLYKYGGPSKHNNLIVLTSWKREKKVIK
jgi:hypothetical protein